jgi:hypothetical protein
MKANSTKPHYGLIVKYTANQAFGLKLAVFFVVRKYICSVKQGYGFCPVKELMLIQHNHKFKNS